MRVTALLPDWLSEVIVDIRKSENHGPPPTITSIVVEALEDRFSAFRPQEVQDERIHDTN